MKDNLGFLKKVQQQLFEDKSENWHREDSLINGIIEELEWQNMSSDEKHERRKAAFSLSEKWAKDPFEGNAKPPDDFNDYPESLVHVYDLTIKLLDRICSSEETRVSNRLKALLKIEQRFFDEKIIPFRHVPLDMFKAIAGESVNEDFYEELSNYILAYERLWELWPKNPYLKRNKEA
jgi:hypothetical protein